MNRRDFCLISAASVASVSLNTACRRTWAGLPNDGRLSARPSHHEPRSNPSPLGSSSVGRQIYLGLNRDRDAILQLPKSANSEALPLLMFLHGATQTAEDMFWYLDTAPDEAGV